MSAELKGSAGKGAANHPCLIYSPGKRHGISLLKFMKDALVKCPYNNIGTIMYT